MDADHDSVLLRTGADVVGQLDAFGQLQIGQMQRLAQTRWVRSTSINSGKSLGKQAISMSIKARLTTPPCCLTPRELLSLVKCSGICTRNWRSALTRRKSICMIDGLNG